MPNVSPCVWLVDWCHSGSDSWISGHYSTYFFNSEVPDQLCLYNFVWSNLRKMVSCPALVRDTSTFHSTFAIARKTKKQKLITLPQST